ncbi:hypothetical protein RhiTH_004097 [Rhizoctonia solani]
MNLKDRQPKKWGQIYLEKLLNGDDEPTLESWITLETAFLHYWSNPAAAQIAEQRLRELKQLKSASNYATEFRIIASKLEWSDPALIASFLDDTLFEARKEPRKDSNSSNSSPQRPAHGRLSDYVSKKVQEARRNAGECSKCGEKSHKWEDCKNAWCPKTIEHSKPESGKAVEMEGLESLPQAGKV